MTTTDTERNADMATKNIFQVLTPGGKAATARLGRLSLQGRKPIDTPNFIALSSRGIIPHLTPDTVSRHTDFGGAYMPLEDFLDKQKPPIYDISNEHARRLHEFTSFPSDRITILGPRRSPPVLAAAGNVSKAINLYTSTGFLTLPIADYAKGVERLQPDIAIAPADLPFLKAVPHSKKLIRMVERTEDWVDGFLKAPCLQEALGDLSTAVFAPVLPVELPIQWDYLRHLSEDVVDSLSGLAVYDANMLPELTHYEGLAPLPKLSMESPKSPHQVLRQVALGMDLCTMPFINSISDAGIAMTFTFPPPATKEVLPLGINMWDTEFQTSLRPLAQGCTCYACTKHHQAFLQHLLNAKEMLGWNLLQIHNHETINRFFAGIRATLQQGEEVFAKACEDFGRVYESELPAGTGLRPRVRGHHLKSEADQKPFNPPAWTNLNGDEGTETPLVPNESADALAQKGFAEAKA